MPDSSSSSRAFGTVSVRLRGRAACVAALALLGCSAPLAAAAPAQTTPAAQTPAAASAPRISNANLQTVPIAGNLAARFKALVDQQTEPAWIAYTQPVIDSQQVGCCYGGNGGIMIDGDNWNNGNGNSCCGQCRLEDRPATGTSTTTTRAATGPIKLEGSPSFAILFRVVSRQIDKLRVFSADCELDAGGRTVHLLTGVPAAESIAFLESVLKDPPASSKSNSTHGAVLAIALHRDPAADAVLQRLLAASYPDSIRRDAVFWLAKARGRVGFDAVKRVIADNNSGSIRKHAVFALTQSREPEVTPMLIDLARNHAQPEVRSEALFWMAQRAGARTAETITEAIERDPDTEVKKKAVFALSQMPKDQGVPLLIQVARTNTNPVVRKQAMFWLGQSKDPRAVDFFEQVLK
jgi:HEAT repeat protein